MMSRATTWTNLLRSRKSPLTVGLLSGLLALGGLFADPAAADICIAGSNNGTTCTDDLDCTGGGVCVPVPSQ